MRKIRPGLTIASLLLAFSRLTVSGQTPANDSHWQLVWEDNFNTLDTVIWSIRNHFDHGGEQQVFLRKNVYTENGNLVCVVAKETYSCPAQFVKPNWWDCGRQYYLKKPYSYTAGRVESTASYNFQYGYIEARIKFPYGIGLWPSFWTFKGDNVVNGVNDAEIDIAEMLGETGSNVIQTNFHRGGDDHRLDIRPNNGYQWENWHTYAVEWSPSKIIWYLDGNPIRTFANHGIVDPSKIILAAGVKREGDVSGMTGFPYKMYTDYVRVYSLKKDCNTDLNVCNYWFPYYDNKVKKNITIGNGSCNNTVFSGQNVIMRASEGILINGNFNVESGAQLYLDVNPCK